MIRVNGTILTFVTLLLLLATVSLAQDLLSLDDAIARALEQNHDIQVARNQEAIGRNNVNLGNANLLPRVDLVASANYRDDEAPESAGGAHNKVTQNNAQIQAGYTLFDGLSNIYTYKQLKRSGTIASLQARSAIEGTILGVGRAFYDVALAQDRLVIAHEALVISNDRYKRSQLKSEYGQANTVEVLSAEVDLNNDSTSLLNARLNLDENRRLLNQLLNRELTSEFRVDTAVTYMADPRLEMVVDQATSNNADYLVATSSLERAKLGVGIARSSFLPHLDLQVAYGYNKAASGFNIDYNDHTKSITTALSLNFNIFNGFQDKVRSQNASLAVKNTELYRDQARLNLERQVTDAFDSYLNSRSILALKVRNLRSAELNFQRTEEAFNLGQVATTTFREAQLNLIQARNDISSAKYSAKVDELGLLKLAGSLITPQLDQ